MAELYGKTTGCQNKAAVCTFSKVTFMAGLCVVGAQIGTDLPVCLAFAEQYRGTDACSTFAFFWRWAAASIATNPQPGMLWKLPVIFICNNNYAMGARTALLNHELMLLIGRRLQCPAIPLMVCRNQITLKPYQGP